VRAPLIEILNVQDINYVMFWIVQFVIAVYSTEFNSPSLFGRILIIAGEVGLKFEIAS
jgi:hypothetical protein